jgi:penicillin-binding protein 1C
MTTTPPPESPADKNQRLAAPESQPAPDSEPKPDAPSVPPPSPPGPPEPPASTDATPRFPLEPPQPQTPTDDSERTERWVPFPTSTAPSFQKVDVDESGMPRPSKKTETGRRIRYASDNDTPVPGAQFKFPPDIPSDEELFAEAPTVRREAEKGKRSGWGCLWRWVVNGIIALFFAFLVVVIILTYGYWSIARALPPVADLRERASQFETTRVYDAKGNLLYEIVDPQAGRRTHVPLKKISPYLIAATIATEDKNFYSHPGFDPVGIVRAIWQNTQAGETVSGASTITQQLVRTLVLSPEERAQRTNLRKIREIILAAEITRTYSKDDILELYLNEIYYGNLAYGVEAAAETYFGKSASGLTLAEASFLAGLPQSPAVYDIFTNEEATLARHRDVLGLMLALSSESPECILVSTQIEPVCVTADDAASAILQISSYPFTPPKNDARFPHWVNYIRQILEDQYGAQTIYRSGYNVYTTLDPDLQALAEKSVSEQVAALADRNVTNGALVALRPGTGEILVMVGSDNYDDPVDGQINMALRPRQPGSSIKPLTYALTFEKGWTPATLLWDVPTEFPDGVNPPYKPVNYDNRFHGPALVRSALANSYNIPAVKALQFMGIYGDGGFIKFAETLGVASLTSDQYGLSLTLGGGEVPLAQMVEAYGALANGGQRVFPIAIRKITDPGGNAVCEQPLSPAEVKSDPPPCQTPPENWGRQVVSPETAFLISDILSDNAARTPAFGPSSPLLLSFPAAAKTGTTNDFRDNWTIGYTPNLVVGVWVGNADFTPMEHTTGVSGAAPIWHTFMEDALGGGRAASFVRPSTIVEKTVCGLSGAEPSEFCPPESQRVELFALDKPPLPAERDLWQRIFIDPFTGLRLTAECAQHYQNDRLLDQQKLVIAVSDPFAQKWLAEDPQGQAWAAAHNITPPITWAPPGDCTKDSPHPLLSFAYPPEGATLTAAPIQISGQAAATGDFDHFIIEYGLSHDPIGWGSVAGPNTNPFPETGRLADWDMSSLPDGPVTLRIIVFSKSGRSAEARVRFMVQRPTATPTPTDTETATPTVTETATITPTSSSTPLPTSTFTPLPTPTVSNTPAPTDTPLPTPTPTDTPLPTAADTPTETPTP